MTEFTLLAQMPEKDYIKYLLLSSLNDMTIEGVSIKEYALRKISVQPKIKESDYKYLPFSSSKPISGCDYQDLKIRKGSVSAICKYIGKKESGLSDGIKELIVVIAKSHGTHFCLPLIKRLLV